MGVLGTALTYAITGGLVVVVVQEVLRRLRLPRLALHYEDKPEYCGRTPFEMAEPEDGHQQSPAAQRAGGQTSSTVVTGTSAATVASTYYGGRTDTYSRRSASIITPSREVEATYLRIKVTNSRPKTFAANCRAYITRVVRTNADGSTTDINSQDALRIPWSLSDPAVDTVDIPSGINQFVDVCYTVSEPSHANKLYCAARPFPFRLRKAWEGTGKFEVTVMVTADGVAPVTRVIRFEWKGTWDSLRVIEAAH
jgi:hypothetical protein